MAKFTTFTWHQKTLPLNFVPKKIAKESSNWWRINLWFVELVSENSVRNVFWTNMKEDVISRKSIFYKTICISDNVRTVSSLWKELKDAIIWLADVGINFVTFVVRNGQGMNMHVIKAELISSKMKVCLRKMDVVGV